MTRFDDLRHTLRYLEAGEPVPAELAKWLGAGFRAFLSQGGRLDDHLELRARIGRYNEVPKYADGFQRRNQLFIHMSMRLSGRLSRRAEIISEAITRYKRHEPLQSRVLYESICELHQIPHIRIPRSQDQIVRILRKASHGPACAEHACLRAARRQADR